MEYEAEIVAVIGRETKNVSETEALDTTWRSRWIFRGSRVTPT